MERKENDLLILQTATEIKKEIKIEYELLDDTSLSVIEQLHKLFPQWRRASVIKKLKDTHDKKDYRFVARLGGEIIAHVKYEKGKGIHKHTMHITSLIVSKGHRRKGIAQKLMEHSIKALPKETKILTLAVDLKNKPAINLYKKIGFKKYGLLKKASQIKGKFVDNYMMEKHL